MSKLKKLIASLAIIASLCALLTACDIAYYPQDINNLRTDLQSLEDGENPANDNSFIPNGLEVDNTKRGKAYIDDNNSLLIESPIYTGEPYTVINDNVPFFSKEELLDAKTLIGFESYSNLDELGRCGTAYALLGIETMPEEGETRGKIGMIKPSGWQTIKYDFVDGKYLYNRCHLIGWQLSAENANEENLITGTRYMNTVGMLPFENEVASYIRRTGNHVLYRVTPVFYQSNLVADGVLMEALSVEDNEIEFCVFCHNVQPGVYIDYKTGDSLAING